MAFEVVSRNPRWAVTTLILILASFLLLASQYSGSRFPHQTSQSPPGAGQPGSSDQSVPHNSGTSGWGMVNGKFSYGSLANILAKQEETYQETIRLREQLIQRWGPSRDQIQIFPPGGGRFYTLWDFLIPAFSCPYPVNRVGTLGDGGKWVCGVDKIISQKKCIIYSFGVNGESSFEAEILRKSPTCEFWGYDFSVSSWGPQITNNAEWAQRAHFFPYRLDNVDEHEAHPPKWTLAGIMEANGHDFIDILKVDIEGSEYTTLTSLVEHYKGRDLPFGQLQLEIHVWNKTFKEFMAWWESLESAGLRPFWTEPNLPAVNFFRSHPPDVSEWSFINIRGKHALLLE